MSQSGIPFNRPGVAGNELHYIGQAIQRGRLSGDGDFTKSCSTYLEQTFGVKKALLTTSCTHALEMSALLLGIQPGDEVIVPSFTFVSTINAFVLRGAQPVFVDIRPDTLNLDETALAKSVSAKTRAIVPIHYAGVGCEMDTILELASEHRIPVVEDNAHGLFGKYKGRFLGTMGCMATQSFHETKNFTCGEGGALLINDPSYVERAEVLREKGTNRSRFFRGEVDKYTWVDVGSSYLPSEILAAFLMAQFEAASTIQATRARLWERYRSSLEPWARRHGVMLPIIPAHCEQSYHMFYLLFASLKLREALRKQLNAKGILSVFHYLPLHLSEMGQRFGGKQGDCPVTEEVSDRLLRLPLYNGLREQEQDRVIDAILEFDGD